MTSSGLVPVHLVLRLCFAWSKICPRRCTSCASSPRPTAACLWTAVLVHFRWLRHVCFYHSTGGLSGATWTRSMSGHVSHNLPLFLLDKNETRNRLLPGTMLCSELLPHLSKHERTGPETLHRYTGDACWFPVMLTLPLRMTHHL